MGETDLPRDLPHGSFVIAVSVHETDRDRSDAVVIGSLQRCPRTVCIQRRQHFALGGQALFDLYYGFVQQFRQVDPTGKNIRPVLVADAKLIGEPARHRQYRPFALAFEQCVRRHRRAHLNSLDDTFGQRCTTCHFQGFADTLQRGILVPFRVFGKQLVREQLSVRRTDDKIGERPAPVDPKLPLILRSI